MLLAQQQAAAVSQTPDQVQHPLDVCRPTPCVHDQGGAVPSERVTAGMKAFQARGRQQGRPGTPQRIVNEIEELASSPDLSVRAIQEKIAGRASRGIVGGITKQVPAESVVT